MDPVNQAVGTALTASLGSGARELSELIADKIRYLRWQSAVKTLERAKAFAEPYGGLNNTPPIKFFIPFMEYCSLEESDEQLVDMWANLLVSASVEFKPGHLVFMRILKEITGDEARLLNRIATVGGRFPTPKESEMIDAEIRWSMLSAPASPLGKIDICEWESLVAVVEEKIIAPGIAVEHLALEEGHYEPFQEIQSLNVKDTVLDVSDYLLLEILISLNVIRQSEEFYYRGGNRIHGVAYCMTAMGGSFFAQCSGLPFGHK